MARGAAFASGSRTSTPASSPPRRALVLVVEDNELASGAIALVLRESGYDVHVAATIRDAVTACREYHPAVMLLDLTLPDGDGLGVLPLAREYDSQPAITAALTGHDDPAVVRRCLAAGCVAVLTKPVPVRDLVRQVGEWTRPSHDTEGRTVQPGRGIERHTTE